MKTPAIVCSAFYVLLVFACTSEPKSDGAPSTKPPSPPKASPSPQQTAAVDSSADLAPQASPTCEPLEAGTLTAGFVPPESPRNTRISIVRRSRFVRCKGAAPVPYPETPEPSTDGWGEAYPVTATDLPGATLNPWERGGIIGLQVTEQGGICPDESLHPMSSGTCGDSNETLVPAPEVQFEHQYTFSLEAPFHKPVEVVVGPDDWDFDPRISMHGKWLKEPLAKWDRAALSVALREGFQTAKCAQLSVGKELATRLEAQIRTASEIAGRAGADSPLSNENYRTCVDGTLKNRMWLITEGRLKELPARVQSRFFQRAGLDEPMLRAVDQDMPNLLAEIDAEVTGGFEAEQIQCDLSPAFTNYFQCEFRSGPKSAAGTPPCALPQPQQAAKELAPAPAPVLLKEASFEKVDFLPPPRWYEEQLAAEARGGQEKDLRRVEFEEEKLEEEEEEMQEESESPSEYAMFPPVRRTGHPIGAPSATGPWAGSPVVHAYLRSPIVEQKGCDASPIVEQIGPVLEASALCCGALMEKDVLDAPSQADMFLYFEAGKPSGGAKVLSKIAPSGAVRQCLFDVGEHVELSSTLPQPCGVLLPMEISPANLGRFGLGDPVIGRSELGSRHSLRERKHKTQMKFGPMTVGGECKERDIVKVVRTRAAAFRFCYERSLMKDPTVSGKLTAKFSISETGRGIGVRVVGEPESMEPVAICAAKRLAIFRFAKPSSGICTAEFSMMFRYEE